MSNITSELASKQLDRVLGFFPRVEAKASFLFALDTGLLALMALNVRLEDFRIWFLIVPAIAAFTVIIASLYFVYRCNFPTLKGGASSLIYFREIARWTEANFIDEFCALDEGAFVRDLLGQVWRNSEILKAKYDAMKVAFVLTAIALIPWTIFLGTAAVVHSGGIVFK